MNVTPGRIEIAGVDERGAFYATQTLMQLIEWSSDVYHVPSQTILDWPAKPSRALSGLPQPEARLLKILARFKISHYMVPGSTMPEEDRTIAVDRFVQVVPMVQFNWAWQPNPEEYIEREPNELLSNMGDSRRNPCPSHPAMWEGYFKQIDRCLEYPTQYIDVNMDEMYQPKNGSRWNVCARCRSRNLSGHELLAETIVKIDAYIRSKGKKMMMIDAPFSRVGISHPDDKGNDWRKVPDILAEKGLAGGITVYCWRGLELSQRLKALGFNLLKWDEGLLREPLHEVYDGLYTNMSDGPFKPGNVISMAQSLWSPQRALGASPEGSSLITAALPEFDRIRTGLEMPSRRKGATFHSIDLKPAANRTRHDEAAFDGQGWADLGPNYDLRALPAGKQVLAGVPFDILPDNAPSSVMVHNRKYFNRTLPQRVSIPVAAKAASICFLHTLDARMSQNYNLKQELAGYYFVVYDDGTYQPYELKYGVNICNFDGLNTFWFVAPRGETMGRGTLAWKGQLGAGNEAALYVGQWVNPYPDKVIDRIIMASPTMAVGVSPILLAATAVEPAPLADRSPPPAMPEAKQRLALSLEAVAPVGKRIDLTVGHAQSSQIWVADNGIRVEFELPPENRVRHQNAQRYRSAVECVLFDNNEAYRPTSRSGMCTIVLPTPRSLSGVYFIGRYREEDSGTQIDRAPSAMNWEVQVSDDGVTFRTVKSESLYVPEEQPPVWTALPDSPVKAVRIITSYNRKEGTNANGLSFVEIYER